jgi:hypothetical protein
MNAKLRAPRSVIVILVSLCIFGCGNGDEIVAPTAGPSYEFVTSWGDSGHADERLIPPPRCRGIK